ncbi:MAG: hypothetical protein GWP07_00340 [Xanthomonadaceae bacterium]|nr:hypothetical protein [Xanthomonadaceae bacterium]
MTKLLVDPVNIQCGGKVFQVSGSSFFQTNTRQAEVLLQVVEKFLRLDPSSGKVLVDLFSGVGLFSLAFADSFEHVYGIESSLSAVSDARCNSEAQGVDNVSWIAGRAEDEFASLAAGLLGLDTIIIDPPRQGCERRLLMQLAASQARKIIYVSCDLATLCRDLQILAAGGFQTLAVQPLDMFPHTYHIECLALLIKNSP